MDSRWHVSINPDTQANATGLLFRTQGVGLTNTLRNGLWEELGLAAWCAEFLIHAVDVEGLCRGIDGDLAGGFYIKPTLLEGTNDMRVFQEEIFGPVLAVTTFKDEAEALSIANDTLYGLGAGVWTRNGTLAYRMGRAIKAGRVWTNCYHLYPAGAAFGGYKISGVGRENHQMMLEHYTQTKNLLVSYSPDPLGFF